MNGGVPQQALDQMSGAWHCYSHERFNIKNITSAFAANDARKFE